jgi:hypothetical protein
MFRWGIARRKDFRKRYAGQIAGACGRVSRSETGRKRRGQDVRLRMDAAPEAALRSKLVIERGVAIAEERREGPDAEGRSEREFEKAEESGDDGNDATPGCAVHESPTGEEGEAGAQDNHDPGEVNDGGPKPRLGSRAVCPWTMHPRAEGAVEKGAGKGKAGDAEGEGQPAVDEPDGAERANSSSVLADLEPKIRNWGNGRGCGTATLRARRLPGG